MAVLSVEQRKLNELRELCEGTLLPGYEYLFQPQNDLVLPKSDSVLAGNRHGENWHLLVVDHPDQRLVEARLAEELASEVYEDGQTKQAAEAAIKALSADIKRNCQKRAFQFVLAENIERAKNKSRANGPVKVRGSLAEDMRNAFSRPTDLREAQA